MRYECEITFTLEAPDPDDAGLRAQEVAMCLDWITVPDEYAVEIGDAAVLRALTDTGRG